MAVSLYTFIATKLLLMKNLILAVALLFGPIVTKMNASDFFSSPAADGNFSMFHGHRQGNGVGLMWAMASSTAIVFEVEKSYDGEYFDKVGQMDASSSGRYRYADNEIFPGYIHYRIKAINEDGTFEYSETVIVRIVSKK